VYISIYDGHVMAMPSYPVPSGPFPLSNVLVASKEKSATEKTCMQNKKASIKRYATKELNKSGFQEQKESG
jgi:hypothetical protein